MSLQNLFEMVKADRYTADGCEALNKAREADVEDRRYKNGEISETTGLMKTPKGWVEPPKGGRTPKGNNSGMSKHWVQKGEKADFVERTPQEEKAMWEKVAARQSDDKLKLAIKNREGRELSPVERIKYDAAVKELSNREIDKKIKANPDYPFKPKTESERAERAKFEKDRDDFIERMDKIRQENNKSKSDGITNSEGKLSDKGRQAYEDHARKISTESLESLIRNKDKTYVKHNDEIADIYKKELERRNGVNNSTSLSKEDYFNSVKQSESKKWNDFFSDMDKKVYGESKPDLRELPQHLEQAYPQNMTITKEDEERFGKAALSGLSGPRESASEWITSSNGDRMQVSEAQNKIQSNQQKIDSLKKEMEGKSKADNFRVGAELKRLENENEYLRERVPANGLKPGALEEMKSEVDSPETRKNYDDFMKAYKKRERDYLNGDCAPRQLTGDCKIRVRKS